MEAAAAIGMRMSGVAALAAPRLLRQSQLVLGLFPAAWPRRAVAELKGE